MCIATGCVIGSRISTPPSHPWSRRRCTARPSRRRVLPTRAENPHVKWATSEKRGHVRLEITPQRCEVHLRVLDSEKTLAVFEAPFTSEMVVYCNQG
jgi:hypothetical protein